jgi:hypothetical protein
MNVPRALSDRPSNARSSQAVRSKHGRASSSKSLAASEWAVRPLAASARPRRFEAGSVLCAEPTLGIEEKGSLPRHSFLVEAKGQAAMVSLCRVTACSERMQAPRRSAEPKTRSCAARAALPNPSIERDAQRLAPLSAPHVKRWAAATHAHLGSRLSTLLLRAAHCLLEEQSQRVGLAAVGAPGKFVVDGPNAAP